MEKRADSYLTFSLASQMKTNDRDMMSRKDARTQVKTILFPVQSVTGGIVKTQCTQMRNHCKAAMPALGKVVWHN